MISILIPTYNCIAVNLIKELHSQCLQLEIDFEIICLDDASHKTDTIIANREINTLHSVVFEELPQNIGRSAIRNKLAEKAKYPWLLYLDADVIPIQKNFISNYNLAIKNNNNVKVVYGGRKHLPRHNSNQKLRWKYGFYKEDKTKEERNRNPYISIITNNLLVKKDIFHKIKFDESLKNYGHEDTLFSYHLKKENVEVLHIDNYVNHQEIDSNQEFITKTEFGLQNLHYLCKNGNLPYKYAKITSYYQVIRKFHLNYIFIWSYKIFMSKMKKNLLSKSPSLKVFNIYKFCYFCNLNQL
ncbi:glycosyltransferase family 2 protein [Mesonia oceanica]|uniref:Uncharacterized protein n=1 Tax=Mesonia oceanica TaxID=2687242 RepID=A0AC61Y9N4_9FLAO|nr:glycosyltransferase family 2 protein [Mesonia oceanica]MAQ41129.1 glycosyl transferase [Mesonia sp.]VVV01227.1 hypothetical protein FVB9532_02512 [Mesonia oceanica]|tara:strand:+ start:12077 stop:12973 length:897 start_codon:yes stop_codon:yes gene_type:complete